ncbi:hypothetical protein SAMN05216439_1694 [Methanobrevibacter gottschalkii]|uniref:Uncharacterized protein n=1 Tax=Methanobrevibacter gottschalkii TaxID=190974 RepID=A0A1H7L3Y1_9EURY|nr:hypothetical protein SAMN05216439_1694 [Methanobrevibacter gottschalkii]
MKNLEIYRNIANFVSNFNIYGTSGGKIFDYIMAKNGWIENRKKS